MHLNICHIAEKAIKMFRVDCRDVAHRQCIYIPKSGKETISIKIELMAEVEIAKEWVAVHTKQYIDKGSRLVKSSRNARHTSSVKSSRDTFIVTSLLP